MKCLFEDADRRSHESRTIFNWILEMGDLVYRAEAAIERHAALSKRRRGFRKLVGRYSCSLEKYNSFYVLDSEISPIKSRLERINKDKEMLENDIKKSIINNPDGGANKSARKTFPNYEVGDCFVGMADELKQLVHLLGQENEDRVISVWGMGGSGKTTIAKNLYNETSFDLSAWVCITQQCQSFQSVWEDVLKQLEHQSRKGVSDGPHLRSLQIFNHCNSIEFPPQSIVDFQNFKLLRDLFMVGFNFAGRKLPKGITNLVHLSCLRLEDCEFDKLPSSIRNLVYIVNLISYCRP